MSRPEGICICGKTASEKSCAICWEYILGAKAGLEQNRPRTEQNRTGLLHEIRTQLYFLQGGTVFLWEKWHLSLSKGDLSKVFGIQSSFEKLRCRNSGYSEASERLGHERQSWVRFPRSGKALCTVSRGEQAWTWRPQPAIRTFPDQ